MPRFSSAALKKIDGVLANRKRISTQNIIFDKKNYTLLINDAEKPISYKPTPTGLKLHTSSHKINLIKGPFGSGKSVACCANIVMRAINMPLCKDGMRHYRCAIVRNSYPELRTTTIQTWLDWFSNLGEVNLNLNPPMRYIAKFNDGNGIIELQIWFISLDKERDLKKLKSLEITDAYLNEASELREDVFGQLMGRINRYPKKGDLTDSYSGQVFMDTNPPDTDHWIYRLFVVKRPAGFALFEQPPAMIKSANDASWIVNPLAENIQNLSAEYYPTMILGKSQEFINVYALGKWGMVSTGRGVYEEYNDDLHCSDKVKYDPEYPIDLGWDYGLSPACAITQTTIEGWINIIGEVTTLDSGLDKFLDEKVIPYLNSKFPNYVLGSSCGDPAGKTRNDNDEGSCQRTLNFKGIRTHGAYSNAPNERIGAVKKGLSRLVMGRPQLMISPDCPNLRKGFIGHYQRERVYDSAREEYKDAPAKNFYSHIHDALQYRVMDTLKTGTDNAPRAPMPLNFIK